MTKLGLLALSTMSVTLIACAGNDLEKIGSTFGSLDNDHDGYISKEEADDDEIWEHFAMIDGNTDGEISRAEFNAYMQANAGLVAEDQDVVDSAKDAKVAKLDPIEHDFATLDEDENGYISLEEADDNQIEKHFGYVDSNRDSRVSRLEYQAYVRR
ncbi:EF-hand domain-containing protein [Bowmanella dokdonensis]|uniref:EF-hand domain-containing protein n=1 Tax=Bowmanella dokdonensis TaxID=751969 RepID=A0A939DK85_9ALTE|nr:EF-hand domain-containing protein [Bowmanella dokdonensis]MBN7824269.1 EF-hand domain-containing protein [Bowmanella dokdonensis]